MQKRDNGNRIRELRQASGLKPHDVAHALRVDTSTVYAWEKGSSAIPDTRKFQLAELFGVSVVWLMGWEGQESSAA